MTRVRTHRTNKYFTLSNDSAQDNSLSFEALGLLTYCLSMPEDWEYNPTVIWKQRSSSRKKTYKMFDELIESFHCIRVTTPNKKDPNLFAEIKYEIFDDIEDCKARIAELSENGTVMKNGYNLKECLPRSNVGHAEGGPIIKETKKTKETTTSDVVVSFQKKKIRSHECLKNCLELSDSQKEKLSLSYSEDVVKNALSVVFSSDFVPRLNYYMSMCAACREGWKPAPKRQDPKTVKHIKDNIEYLEVMLQKQAVVEGSTAFFVDYGERVDLTQTGKQIMDVVERIQQKYVRGR